MLRTRVGSVIPTSPTPTVGERILSNWSNARRQEFELAMRQAMLEYQEGKLTQSQMVAERARAIELLAKDLQNIRNTREKLLSGELDRSAAIQRFNAGQENAARRTYSSQAFAAQRDAVREAGRTRKEKEEAEADIDLTKEQKALVNQVTANAISNFGKLSQDEQDQTSLGEYIFQDLKRQMSEAKVEDPKSAPLVGVDPREAMKQADQVIRNIGSFGQVEMEPGLERIRSKEGPGIMTPGPTTLPAIPGPGSIYGEMDVDSEIEDEDEETVPGVRRPIARPVGYSPTFAGRGRISEDVRKELDYLAERKDSTLKTLREIYNTLPEVDEFDLIDQTRRIWREKFGRNPSAEETRSILRKAKSPETPVEPVEDVMGVAGSREELKERVAELQGTTTPTPSPSVEDETPEEKERRQLEDNARFKQMPSLRDAFIQPEQPEDLRAKLRFKFYDPGLQRKVIRDGYGNIVEDETPEEKERRQLEDNARFKQMPSLRDAFIQPSEPAPLTTEEQYQALTPLSRASYDAALRETLSPIQPIPSALAKGETFEDIDDIYSRAVKRAKSGSISIGPKDRETVDRTIRLWKNGGKKLSPEQLIETIEKGFEDMPEDRVEQILAYMIRKMNAEMTK